MVRAKGAVGGRRWSAGARRVPWAWALAVVVALGVGVVAGRATFVPPQQAEEVAPVQMYTVAEASVGATTSYTATARWPVTPLGSGAGSGTVTSVAVTPGQEVDQGDVLYELDLRPVVVARGSTPAFRDLSQGASGDDVGQLQQLLVDTGHLRGEVTGKFDARTRVAVRAWQASLGVQKTGVVGAGDVVFAADLPGRVVLAEGVAPGAMLEPGTPVVSTVADAPTFTISAGDGQNSAVPPTGTAVSVLVEGLAFDATVTEAETGENGGTVLHLAGQGGSPVCADQCAVVPFSLNERHYTATAVLQPEVTGPAVPVAAVGTAADGSRFVVTPDGERVPVTVTAADGSRAIVEGVGVGDVVALFATASDDEGSDDDGSEDEGSDDGEAAESGAAS